MFLLLELHVVAWSGLCCVWGLCPVPRYIGCEIGFAIANRAHTNFSRWIRRCRAVDSIVNSYLTSAMYVIMHMICYWTEVENARWSCPWRWTGQWFSRCWRMYEVGSLKFWKKKYELRCFGLWLRVVCMIANTSEQVSAFRFWYQKDYSLNWECRVFCRK
jgi:hypothetical protein